MEKPNTTLFEDNIKKPSQNQEIVAKEENSDTENNHTELVKFSKRYSRGGRQKIASDTRPQI